MSLTLFRNTLVALFIMCSFGALAEEPLDAAMNKLVQEWQAENTARGHVVERLMEYNNAVAAMRKYWQEWCGNTPGCATPAK